MNKKEYTFEGKSLAVLSLAELREFESATIEAIIIDNDSRILTNQKLADLPNNTSLLFDKRLFESNIKRNELQLDAIRHQLNATMLATWI